jgi:hypothetical protein
MVGWGALMRILAIDPGPERSAWCVYGMGALDFGTYENSVVLSLAIGFYIESTVVIEKVESFGMAVGAEVFETVYWSGRFAQQAIRSGSPVDRIGRKAIKLHLCGTTQAKDANIRAALIDRYGPGKDVAIGTKRQPGPLHGVSGDVWSALAVAVTWADLHGEQE